MDNFLSIILQITVLIFSVIIHEVAHGYVAYKLGDPTAKYSGRLTLNPLPHIDPFMSILLPALMIFSGAPFIIGGAKPVPVNPIYFQNHKRDIMLVSFAGPLSNILFAILSLIILKIAVIFKLLSPGLLLFVQYAVFINAILAAFNLIPIPPLDGSKILMGFLPDEIAFKYMKIEPFGIFIIIFLLAAGILQLFLLPVYYLIQTILNFII